MLVVTADHGLNLTPPDLGREIVTEGNSEEVFRVPLFIKVPGQTVGDVRDEPALTMDVVPSIADVLDVEVDDSWHFDGHSLFDGSPASFEPMVSPDVDAVLDIAARRAEQFPHGDDWQGLAAVGDNGDLVGREIADLDVGRPSAYEATLDQERLFDDLPTDDGQAPVRAHRHGTRSRTGWGADRTGGRRERHDRRRGRWLPSRRWAMELHRIRRRPVSATAPTRSSSTRSTGGVRPPCSTR